jgi:hypothetical protein
MAKSKAKRYRERKVRQGEADPILNRVFFPEWVGKPFISPFKYPKTLKQSVEREETKHRERFESSLLI